MIPRPVSAERSRGTNSYFCVFLFSCREQEASMKITTITLAIVVAVASSLAVAQGAGTKYDRHSATRHMKARPTLSTYGTSSCRSIPGMGTDNIYGVDNDLN